MPLIPSNGKAFTEDTSNGQVCEITPEMVEAGVTALAYFDPYFESDAAGAEKIYRAMEKARTGNPVYPEDFERDGEEKA